LGFVVQIQEYAVSIKLQLLKHSNINLLLTSVWYLLFADRWLKITWNKRLSWFVWYESVFCEVL